MENNDHLREAAKTIATRRGISEDEAIKFLLSTSDEKKLKKKIAYNKWVSKNPNHVRELKQRWFDENKEKTIIQKRKWNFLDKYNITPEEAEQMLKDQNNMCLICGGITSLGGRTGAHIDHDHITNEIRGILCNNCNIMLGHSKENITTLFNAINYLRSFNGWGKKKIS